MGFLKRDDFAESEQGASQLGQEIWDSKRLAHLTDVAAGPRRNGRPGVSAHGVGVPTPDHTDPWSKPRDDLLRVFIETQPNAGLADVLVERSRGHLHHHHIVDAALFAMTGQVGIKRHHGSEVTGAIRAWIAQLLV